MKNINLLIVDDKIENLISLTALLNDIVGINIISSQDPNEALRICYKQNIDIALVDVQMPDINGFEFVELIKHNPKTSHIIAIMVTAISKEEKYLIQGLNSGAVDYLYKPLSPEITIAKVKSFIQQVQTQNEIKEKNQALENSKEELIRAKEEAELARKSKETFLANMSHEIRTPINGVMGIAQMLKNSPLSLEQQDWVNKLNSASLNLLNIVNDILDLSKFDSGMMKLEIEPTSVHDITDDLKNLFVHKAIHQGLNFSIYIDEKIDSFFLADPLRLKQILTNFISNSFKFTAEGSITLNINLIDSNVSKLHLQFQVTDTGIGIPEHTLEKIFFAFEQGEDGITKKFGGTGLGLAIVKKLSILLGGKVTAVSTYGKGSEFTFDCWFDRTTAVTKSKPEKILYSELKSFDNLKILVAEDNELNSFMLANILRTWNCEIKTANNGKAALEKVESEDFDIIFMDSHMPIMSGFETIRRIRQHNNPAISNILIISISASVLEAEQQEALDAGANNVIGKPFDPNHLHEMIEKMLRKKYN